MEVSVTQPKLGGAAKTYCSTEWGQHTEATASYTWLQSYQLKGCCPSHSSGIRKLFHQRFALVDVDEFRTSTNAIVVQQQEGKAVILQVVLHHLTCAPVQEQVKKGMGMP